jgi:hypothetical protein
MYETEAVLMVYTLGRGRVSANCSGGLPPGPHRPGYFPWPDFPVRKPAHHDVVNMTRRRLGDGGDGRRNADSERCGLRLGFRLNPRDDQAKTGVNCSRGNLCVLSGASLFRRPRVAMGHVQKEWSEETFV